MGLCLVYLAFSVAVVSANQVCKTDVPKQKQIYTDVMFQQVLQWLQESCYKMNYRIVLW